MKVKRTLFIGAALVLLGAVIFAAGYRICGGDVSSINGSIAGLRVNVGGVNGFGSDSGEYSRHEYEFSNGTAGEASPAPVSPAPTGETGSLHEYDFAGGTAHISLKELWGDVSIGQSPDEKIHLSAMESEHYYLHTESSEEGLCIERRSDDSHLIFNIGASPELKLELLLPAGVEYCLEVENDLGNITVSGVRIADGDFESSSGNIRLTDIDASGDISAECDNGDLTLTDVSCLTLSADNDCGNVRLERVSSERTDIDASLGSVTLTGVKALRTLSVNADCGDVSANGISAEGGIKLSCGLGSISGTIEGELADYSVTSHTELGSNSLPEALSLGPVTLEVYSDCGDIDIGFEK